MRKFAERKTAKLYKRVAAPRPSAHSNLRICPAYYISSQSAEKQLEAVLHELV